MTGIGTQHVWAKGQGKCIDAPGDPSKLRSRVDRVQLAAPHREQQPLRREAARDGRAGPGGGHRLVVRAALLRGSTPQPTTSIGRRRNEGTSLVHTYRADQWASCKATHNPHKHKHRLDDDEIKARHWFTRTGLTNGRHAKRHATLPGEELRAGFPPDAVAGPARVLPQLAQQLGVAVQVAFESKL
jgi:hypothetical protein